jgi:hypothetical protein
MVSYFPETRRHEITRRESGQDSKSPASAQHDAKSRPGRHYNDRPTIPAADASRSRMARDNRFCRAPFGTSNSGWDGAVRADAAIHQADRSRPKDSSFMPARSWRPQTKRASPCARQTRSAFATACRRLVSACRRELQDAQKPCDKILGLSGRKSARQVVTGPQSAACDLRRSRRIVRVFKPKFAIRRHKNRLHPAASRRHRHRAIVAFRYLGGSRREPGFARGNCDQTTHSKAWPPQPDRLIL